MTADYDLLIRRIEARTRRRAGFALHATLFICFAVCSIIFMLDPTFWRGFVTLPNTGDIFLILVVWGIFFAARAARFYFQEAGDRQIEALYSSTYQQAKPKRSRLALAEDGEIVVEDEDDWAQARRQAR